MQVKKFECAQIHALTGSSIVFNIHFMRDDSGTYCTFNDTINWLRLIRSANVGPQTFYKLLSRFGSAGAALEALPEMARRGGMKMTALVCPRQDAEREIDHHHRLGAKLISRDEALYPPRLRHIGDAPPLISVLGQIDLLRKRAVAVVGARNSSVNGLRIAEQLARDLGDSGMLVVSGLARGIDAAAHRGSLPTGTLAALGGGVDVIYPRENAEIYDAIKEHGVLVTEFAPGTRPRAQNFPRRNRIIAGISRGIVVVEAAPRSGSLITARLALEQGREVFAVPGSAIDPRARGTNDLIRQGAILTETANDVLEVISPERQINLSVSIPSDEAGSEQPDKPIDNQDTDEARKLIERFIGPTPTHVDTIIRECAISSPALSAALLELELAGRLERHPGNLISLSDGA